MGKVILPDTDRPTLQDQDDVYVWTIFNVLLQGTVELTEEFGEAGDATRQLRVVTAEVIRRDMFEKKVRHWTPKPTDAQLWTWYEVLKQFIEGANKGEWESSEDAERQYRTVVEALKAGGNIMPAQTVVLERIDMLGQMTKAGAK